MHRRMAPFQSKSVGVCAAMARVRWDGVNLHLRHGVGSKPHEGESWRQSDHLATVVTRGDVDECVDVQRARSEALVRRARRCACLCVQTLCVQTSLSVGRFELGCSQSVACACGGEKMRSHAMLGDVEEKVWHARGAAGGLDNSCMLVIKRTPRSMTECLTRTVSDSHTVHVEIHKGCWRVRAVTR